MPGLHGIQLTELAVCVCALLLCVGCGPAGDTIHSAGDIEEQALQLIDFDRLSQGPRLVITLAGSGEFDRIPADVVAKFVADAQLVKDYGGDEFTAYQLILPQKAGTENPLDGYEDVPCWPNMIVILDTGSQTLKRVIVTVQCL